MKPEPRPLKGMSPKTIALLKFIRERDKRVGTASEKLGFTVKSTPTPKAPVEQRGDDISKERLRRYRAMQQRENEDRGSYIPPGQAR